MAIPSLPIFLFVLNALRNREQNPLHNALLVPWHQLSESAIAFAEWHIFILWIRAITETGDQIPEIVKSALHSRCPGFLEYQCRQRGETFPFWKYLEEWVTEHYFAKARTEGFLDAVIYYAYKDLRTEQAWTAWERSNDSWHALLELFAIGRSRWSANGTSQNAVNTQS